jgi:pyrroloquinoline-quinone synthase
MTATVTDLTTEDLGQMSPAEFVGLLKENLAKPGGGMPDHPFVRALEDGSATTEQILAMISQFYLHIRNMLPWIGEIYVKCPHPDVRDSLVKNLAEECLGVFTRTKAHPELLLEFAEALGADPEELRSGTQITAGRRVTDYFEFMATRRDWYVTLSAIAIGLESFVPETFQRIIDALKKNYNMKDEDLVFWSMHVTADAEHGDEGIELVSEYATDPEKRKDVYDCTLETGRLFYDLWNIYQTA